VHRAHQDPVAQPDETQVEWGEQVRERCGHPGSLSGGAVS
jgi:hypothetical protein